MYTLKKIFTPRLAYLNVWQEACALWNGEPLPRFIPFFVDKSNRKIKGKLLRKWLLDEGAENGDLVILDMN
jgi:hypothetical protein